MDAGPGVVTTDEMDRVIHVRGMYGTGLLYPSPLNYYNFPKSVFTSVRGNEVICHGIPDYDYREVQRWECCQYY